MILDLCGLPVILRTYEAVKATGLFDEVIVVTDSKKIATLTEGHGALTILSQKDHETGSDRIAEAAESVQADVIINVQGDEPFIDSNSLRALIDCFREDQEQRIDLASLMVAITDKTSIDNPNVVKVVTDLSGKALNIFLVQRSHFIETLALRCVVINTKGYTPLEDQHS